LDCGHYYGIDKEPEILEAGRSVELKRAGFEFKKPVLLLVNDFDFSLIQDVKFDLILAQSLFTHLVPAQIELCLKKTMPLLKDEGVFFATFNEALDGSCHAGKPHGSRKNERKRASYPLEL